MKAIVAIAACLFATAAFAGPFNSGMVGGNVKSTVRVGTISQTNSAKLGYAEQKLNVGSIDGAKVLGNVNLNVRVKDITQRNSAMLGYAKQEANIGSIK